jgi:hypothetical protein
VVRMNPQAIVLVRPRGRNFDVSTQLGSLWGLEIEAVLERRVAVLTHPDSFTPSTGVIGVAAELREILESFEAGSP